MDPRRFVLSYEDRARGMLEIPLLAFNPNGDIPWHRVWQVRVGATVIWDRRARIDRVFSDPIDLSGLGEWYDDGFYAPRAVWCFDAALSEWVPAPTKTSRDDVPAALRVVTWNVLSDLHDADKTHPAQRHPRLIEQLGALDADVIVLQEVTPRMLASLVRAPWVRASYAITDVPPAVGLAPQGQVVLARVPMVRAGAHAFSRNKQVVVCELNVGPHRIVLAAVHLTSDRGKNAPATRSEQLAAIVAHLPAAERTSVGTISTMLVGDFNARDDETHEAANGYTDAWRALHPDDAGVTFDPVRNPLAALVSLTGRPARLDRVLLRASYGTLVPTEMERFGLAPDATAGMFLSDHAGLALTLRTEAVATEVSLADRAPVHASALVWLPPHEIPALEAIRAKHDRHRDRWMAHVNVLYGFVPDEDFDAAREIVARVVGDEKPFSVTLARFERFEHRGSDTVWLRPESDPPGALEALQAKLQKAFARCTEQSARGEQGYTAHLTVAQFARSEATAMHEHVARWQQEWTPVRCEVGSLCLISRRGDGPFVVRARVPLGARRSPLGQWLAAHGASGDAAADAARETALGMLAELSAGATVHAIGSHRMGLAGAASDLDVVLVSEYGTSRKAYFNALRASLTEAGVLESWREIDDALAPVVSATLAGVKLDLQHAQRPPAAAGAPLHAMDPTMLAAIDRDSARAWMAILDAEALLAEVKVRADVGVFRTVARALKGWAHARAVGRNAHGFFGGITWAVLAAWGVCRHPGATAEEVLARVFEDLARWQPSEVISLREAHGFSPQPKRDRMPVLAPSAPARNTARNVTRSTAAALRREFARAQTLAAHAARGADADWETLFARAVPEGGCVRLQLQTRNAEDRASAMGWIDRETVGWLLHLERESTGEFRPFPWQHGADGAPSVGTLALSEDGAAIGPSLVPVCEAFVGAFAAWGERPDGATLSFSIDGVGLGG